MLQPLEKVLKSLMGNETLPVGKRILFPLHDLCLFVGDNPNGNQRNVVELTPVLDAAKSKRYYLLSSLL